MTPDAKLAQSIEAAVRGTLADRAAADRAAIIRAAHEYAADIMAGQEALKEQTVRIRRALGVQPGDGRDTEQAAADVIKSLAAERADRETAEAAVAQLRAEFLEQWESWKRQRDLLIQVQGWLYWNGYGAAQITSLVDAALAPKEPSDGK